MADSREADAPVAVTCHPKQSLRSLPSDLPLSCVTCLAYFFDAFGLALARFSFRTEGRVARGLTGDLAR